MQVYMHKDENAIYYECNYSCDNAIYLSIENDKFLITDSRYEIDAKINTKNINICITNDLTKELINILQKNKIKKISINPKEWSYYEVLALEAKNISLELVANLSQKKRIIKTNKEIDYLKQASKLGRDGFDNFAKFIKTELLPTNKKMSEKELALHNYINMSNKGELKTSFDAIVAINANASKPHHHPANTTLNKEDLLLIDAGIKYKRYCSDRTRTANINDSFEFVYNQTFKDKKVQKIYDTVLKAHDTAIANYKVGMKANEIDKLARGVIEEAGFGKYFVHSTGHGVGLDIHEMPYISKTQDILIEENMIFTIEPGIYIQDFIGVRIEDMVVVKNGNLEII